MAPRTDPIWLNEAKLYLGTKPVPVPRTGWCAHFVRGCLEFVGIPAPRSKKARSFLRWGRELKYPVRGCVVVLWRKDPNSTLGHTGFFLGYSKTGNIRVLGKDNLSEFVTVKIYPKTRVLGYRWPNKDNNEVFRRDPIQSGRS